MDNRLLKNPIIAALDDMGKQEIIDTIKELGRKVWGYKLSAAMLEEGVSLLKDIEEQAGAVNLFIDLQLSGTPEFIKEASRGGINSSTRS